MKPFDSLDGEVFIAPIIVTLSENC